MQTIKCQDQFSLTRRMTNVQTIEGRKSSKLRNPQTGFDTVEINGHLFKQALDSAELIFITSPIYQFVDH